MRTVGGPRPRPRIETLADLVFGFLLGWTSGDPVSRISLKLQPYTVEIVPRHNIETTSLPQIENCLIIVQTKFSGLHRR